MRDVLIFGVTTRQQEREQRNQAQQEQKDEAQQEDQEGLVIRSALHKSPISSPNAGEVSSPQIPETSYSALRPALQFVGLSGNKKPATQSEEHSGDIISQLLSNIPNIRATPLKRFVHTPEVQYHLITPEERDTYAHNGTPFTDWMKAHEMMKIYVSQNAYEIDDDDPPVLFKCLPRKYVIDFMARTKSTTNAREITDMFVLQQSPGACVLLCTLQVVSWIRRNERGAKLPGATAAYCKFLLPEASKEKILDTDVNEIKEFVVLHQRKRPPSTRTTTVLGGDNMHFHTTTRLLLPMTAKGKTRQMREEYRKSDADITDLISFTDFLAKLKDGDFGCVLVAYNDSRHGLSLFATGAIVHVFDSWNQTRSELNPDKENFEEDYEGLWGKECLKAKVFEHCIYADAKRTDLS